MSRSVADTTHGNDQPRPSRWLSSFSRRGNRHRTRGSDFASTEHFAHDPLGRITHEKLNSPVLGSDLPNYSYYQLGNLMKRKNSTLTSASTAMAAKCSLVAGSKIPGPHASADSAYAGIAEAVRQSGFLPGPEQGGKNLQSDSDSQERSIFLCNYHTVLVGLMAADLALWKRNVLAGRDPGRLAH